MFLQTYDVNAILQSLVNNASSSFLAGELRVLVLKVLMVNGTFLRTKLSWPSLSVSGLVRPRSPTLGPSAGFRIKPSLVLAGTNDDLDGEEFNSGALTLVRLHCLSILVDGCNESQVTTPSVILFCLGRSRSLCYSRNYTCKPASWAMGGRGLLTPHSAKRRYPSSTHYPYNAQVTFLTILSMQFHYFCDQVLFLLICSIIDQ